MSSTKFYGPEDKSFRCGRQCLLDLLKHYSGTLKSLLVSLPFFSKLYNE